MMRLVFFLPVLFVLTLSSSPATAQKIKFYDNQLSKAKAKTKKKSKILFVDAYASWCGPCKMMDKKIFSETAVVKLHKAEFVNCKIDVESVVGDIFTEEFPIKSIPTLFYFNSDYELIFKKIGAPYTVEAMLEYSQTAIDVNQHLQAKSPINNLKSLYHYTYYLKETEQDYQPYLNAFLEQEENWFSQDAMQIIFDFASEDDSLVLDHFLAEIGHFEETFGKDKVHEKRMMLVLDVILEFLDDANGSPNFEEAQPIFVRYFGAENYLEHLLLFKFRYHQQHQQKAEMRSTLERFVSDVISKMPNSKEQAIEYIQAAANYYDLSEGREDLQAKALEWGEQAAKLYEGYEVFSILAILYSDAGIKDKASYYQQKANQSKKN